ncbi:N-acetyltransferase ESCO1 isoform X1 [Hypanus sabinus]|uniref:N-acetyltransferase ESCO1 isoform X1 n=1 Tax=Hypanus sabinus TaxID=79690 RepID=UPI0028C4CC98|nr:N-acetyltransferase ESCO1 isoform X1 [Hypanus sabinus]
MVAQKRKVPSSPANAQRGSVRTKNGTTGGGPSAKKKRLEEKVTSPQLRLTKQSAAQPRKASSNKRASKSLRTAVKVNRLSSKSTTKLKGKKTKVTKNNEKIVPLKKYTKHLLKNNMSLKSSHQKKSILSPISKKNSGKVMAKRKSTQKQNSAKIVHKQIPVKVSQKSGQRKRTSQSRLPHKILPNSKKTSSKKHLKMSSRNLRTKAPQKISKSLSKKGETNSLRATIKKSHQSKKNVKVQSKSTVNVSRMKPAKKDAKSLSVTSKKQLVKKTAKKVTCKGNHTKQLSSCKGNSIVRKNVSSKKISEKIQISVKSVKNLQQRKMVRAERLRYRLVSEDKFETRAARPQTKSIQNHSKENIQQVVNSGLKSGAKQMLNKGQTRRSQRLNLNACLSTRSFVSTDSASSMVPTQKKTLKRTLSDLYPKSPENKCPLKKMLKVNSKLARTKQENITKSPKKASEIKEKGHSKIGEKTPNTTTAKKQDSNGTGPTACERKSKQGILKNTPKSKTSVVSETSQEQTKTGKLVSHSKTKIRKTASCVTLESSAKLKGLVQNLTKATNCSVKAIKGKTGVETSTEKKQNKVLNNSTENKKKISFSIKEQGSKQPQTVHKANKNTISNAKSVMEIPCLPTDDNAKCKRQSILELCEEIAEEIASDTLDLSVKEESTKMEDKSIPKEPETVTPEDTKKTQRTKPIYSSLNRFQFSGQKSIKRKSFEHHKSNASKYTTQKGRNSWTKIKQIKTDQKTLTAIKFRNLQVKQTVSQVVVQTIKIEKEKLSNGLSLQTKEENGTAHDQHKADTTVSHLEVGRDFNNGQRTTENSTSENDKLVKLCDEKEDEMEVSKMEIEPEADESFRLHLESSPECSPEKSTSTTLPPKPVKEQVESESGSLLKETVRTLFSNPDSLEVNNESVSLSNQLTIAKNTTIPLEFSVQKEAKLSDNADGGGLQQTILDSGQKRIGAISCTTCGMLYAASIPEDEAQHFKFHKHFISAVKYVGWKKERILGEYPDGKIIMVLPDDPKYALKKVEEIREMVDNDLGFQQAELKCPSRTKTLLFISNDRKIVGCLIAEHIQRGFRVIEDKATQQSSNDAIMLERQRAWCCSTNPEPAICGISRVWVFSMMRRKAIATRMTDCLRSNFVYGSYLSKDEIAFSDPTPDGKLFATQYCGTPRFLVYNFVS